MAAGHRTVDRVEHALDADGGIGQVDEEHAGALVGLGHDDADFRAVAPVMKVLRPLMTQ
jgi:hypothetical protein